MEQLNLSASAVPAEIKRWLQQQPQPLLAAIELDSEGQLTIQPLPEVDPLVVSRVLKSMAQYADVLRRLA